ncbi:MAG: hypothetical protein HYY07_01655, partial [Elusimicrobia bacterium]|nr:hypothetical protein [Elusimicrobiota bacterium]
MVGFWTEKKNKAWLRLTAGSVAAAFIFSTVSVPFVQASFWEERKKSIEEYQKGVSAQNKHNNKEYAQLASVAGLSVGQTPLGNGLITTQVPVPAMQSNLSPNLMSEVLKKVKERKVTHKKRSGIPQTLLETIEKYGEIERVHLTQGQKVLEVNGKVEASEPIIIQIQDAHDIYGVQKNIARLLLDLTNLGVSLVGVEGATGRLKGIEDWRDYPDRPNLMKVAGYLMQQGLYTGVELAALGRSHDSIEFYGVEDQAPYWEQVKTFKDTLGNTKDVERWVSELGGKIAKLKGALYSPEMLKLDRLQTQYELGDTKLGEWIEHLYHHRHSRESGNPEQRFYQLDSRFRGNDDERGGNDRNIQEYLKAQQIEKSLDFKQVEKDQRKLLETLSEKLNREELVDLLEESLAYRLGKMSYGEFYSSMQERCRKAGVSVTAQMQSYMDYVIRVEGIDREKLFEEIKSLESDAWSALISNSSRLTLASSLHETDKDFRLMEKALNFRLTPEEWKEFQMAQSRIEAIPQNLNDLSVQDHALSNSSLPKSQRKPQYTGYKIQFPDRVKQVLRNVERFSQLSEDRNGIFVRNLLSRMELKGKKENRLMVLVAGGFHSQGVEQRL